MRARPWILFGILISAVSAVVTRSPFPTSGVSLKDLQKGTYVGVTVELLGTAAPFQIPVPAEIQGKVVSMENFQVLKKSFMSAISKVVYTPEIEANVDGAVEGSISNIMAKQGLTKLGDQRAPTTVSGLPSKRYLCQFTKDGTDFELKGVIAAKGPVLWHVFSFYKKTSRAQDVSTRVLDSVSIAP